MRKLILMSAIEICLAACAAPVTANPSPVIPPRPITTPSSIPSLTPSPTATRDYREYFVSPNGEYSASLLYPFGPPSFTRQMVEVRRTDGSLKWEIPSQTELSQSAPQPMFLINGWSTDSLYLYIYYALDPDGGDFAFWWDGYDLQRLNVQTGHVEQVISGEGFVAFSFSPDGSQLAYTREQDTPSIFYIRDLSSGKEKTAYVIFASRDYIRVGNIHWSPSNTQIAFQTEAADHMVQTMYLNPTSMKQRVINEYKIFTMWFQGWSEDGKLEFLQNGNIVHVDPQSDETIVVGTPTPQR